MDRRQGEADEAAKAVRKGEMPPWDFLLGHPEARLDATEKAELIAGLTATFGGGEAEQMPGPLSRSGGLQAAGRMRASRRRR